MTVLRNFPVRKLFCQRQRPFHIGSDRSGMLVRFPQLDLNAPNLAVLGEDDFRSCFVDSFELTHSRSLQFYPRTHNPEKQHDGEDPEPDI